MTVVNDERLRVMGPIDEGTCSCPSVETGTPMYGNLELCAVVRQPAQSPDHERSTWPLTVGFRPHNPLM
jgi:hypothetical protein